MADYNPPTENLPIFDASVFTTADNYITQADADKRYLRFPNAQGTENLAQINVNGASTFNAISSFKKPLSLNSTTDTDRTINNTYYNLIDKTNNLNIGKIYGDVNDVYYDNDKNSGNHYFLNNTAGGVQTTTLQMNTTNFVINTTTLPTAPLATLPAPTDSTNKIPTTAWVQSAISAIPTANTYTVNYFGSGTIITPSNCRFIDVNIVSKGGNCGSFFPADSTYGGGGSGGNMAIGMGLMIGPNQSLSLSTNNTSTTGFYQITYDGIVMVKVFNGNDGFGSTGGGGGGGSVNTTATVVDSRWGTFFTSFGRAGSGGTTNPPPTGSNAMCPRYVNIWSATVNGCGQRDTTNSTPLGCFSITYHCA